MHTYASVDLGNVGSTAKVSEMAMQVNDLKRGLEEQTKLIEVLRDKLRPILSDRCEEIAVPKETKEEKEKSCPLSRELEELKVTLATNNRTLEEIRSAISL